MRRFRRDMPEGLRRGLWFAGLYLGGVGAVTLVAYGIRAMIL